MKRYCVWTIYEPERLQDILDEFVAKGWLLLGPVAAVRGGNGLRDGLLVTFYRDEEAR